MKVFRRFLKEEDAMGTVEVVLIIVVLVLLVTLFKKAIKPVVEKALKKITTDSTSIIG
ncbi:MAG: hypothetical protein K5894_02535 [Lachnospiraceae bacterium]|nr:hypothetical protein [Lachnospiraceae bacterium]MDN4744648.1 Flp1 family type IVb pilin [Lachnospiraceae bacterium C1.1]